MAKKKGKLSAKEKLTASCGRKIANRERKLRELKRDYDETRSAIEQEIKDQRELLNALK